MTRLDERDDWRTRRACDLDNATLFDPPEGRDEQATGDRIRRARAFCAKHCTVGQQCLTDGIKQRGSGVFDGVVLTHGHLSKQQYEGPAPAERKKQKGRGRPLAPCGTYSAFDRHRRKGEPVDGPCMLAGHAYTKARRDRRGAA